MYITRSVMTPSASALTIALLVCTYQEEVFLTTVFLEGKKRWEINSRLDIQMKLTAKLF